MLPFAAVPPSECSGSWSVAPLAAKVVDSLMTQYASTHLRTSSVANSARLDYLEEPDLRKVPYAPT